MSLYRLRWDLDDIGLLLADFRAAHREDKDTEVGWAGLVATCSGWSPPPRAGSRRATAQRPKSSRKGWPKQSAGYGILTAMTTGDVAGRLGAQARVAVTKVPEITAWFWIAKVASTGMGEATADWLYARYGTIPTGAVGAILLIGALVLQFRSRRYNTWIYWLAVVAVSVTGTMAADGLHIVVGLPYTVTTALYAAILAAIFVVWYRTEGTLSIHSITTVRREAFYWATVMATFALGTALGDLTAYTLKIGFFSSGVLFLVVIAIPAVAHRWLGMNSVLAFWFAYTITRPLGASLADWLGVPARVGGLDWGRGVVAHDPDGPDPDRGRLHGGHACRRGAVTRLAVAGQPAKARGTAQSEYRVRPNPPGAAKTPRARPIIGPFPYRTVVFILARQSYYWLMRGIFCIRLAPLKSPPTCADTSGDR